MIELYKMSIEREKKMWKNAIFVFDSSALLDFYFFPKETREKIYLETFEKISKRLWIPAHVQYEYLKNREKIIQKPIAEHYTPLEDDVKNVQKKVKGVLDQINSIIDKTKKSDKHPYVEQSTMSVFQITIQNLFNNTSEFEKALLEQIELAKKEVKSVKENDDILDAIKKYFKVGRDYTFDEILNITHEGKHRFEYKIPPGYGDFYNKEKKGTQIFGDLIIWKQILEYSKEKKLPIIFITNDIKKDEDWCYLDKEQRILSPREELIKEIHDCSNVEFWMYNLAQFLYFANKHLKSTIEEGIIDDISEFLDEQYMTLKSKLLSLLRSIGYILIRYRYEPNFTRIRGDDEENLYPLIKEYAKIVENYSDKEDSEDLKDIGLLLNEINALNYTIHYQEVRMKRDTSDEEKLLQERINTFFEFNHIYMMFDHSSR